MNSITFFKELYDPDIILATEDWINIITGLRSDKDRKMHWIRANELDKIPSITEEHNTEDIYYGVALRGRRFDKKRGSDTDCTVLPCVWMDIDLKKRNSKKKYPENKIDLRNFLYQDLPFSPTVLIWSGGGYHAYWFFQERHGMPYMKTNLRNEYIYKGKTLVVGWNKYVQGRMKDRGWDVDIVQMHGILRVPGSWNHKSKKNPDEVVIVECDYDKRYDVSDILEYAEMAEIPKDVKISDEKLEVKETPTDKLNVLLVNNKKFNRTYKRERSDFQDQSASSYCISMMYYMVRAEWSEEEIYTTLYNWRKQHGESVKPDSWYKKQIARLQAEHEKDKSLEAVNELPPEKTLEVISDVVGHDLVSVKRVVPVSDSEVGEDCSYLLKFKKGKTIYVKDTKTLCNSNEFAILVTAQLKIAMLPVKSKEKWNRVVQAILNISVDEEDVSEASEYQTVMSYLREYISDCKRYTTFEEFACAKRRSVLRFNDKYHIRLNDFREWLGFKGNNISIKKLATIMGFNGCKKVVRNNVVGEKGKRTTINCWRLPDRSKK